MVKVLEKRIEESYTDRLWRIVLGTTAEIIGSKPVTIDPFCLDEKQQPSPEILRQARIIAAPSVGTICIDYCSPKESKEGISVNPVLHRMTVYDPAHYALARQLAQAYEQRLEEGPDREFTLQKEYQG